MGVQFANNAASTLASSITNVATTISLAIGTGALFPAASVVSGNYFYLTLIDSANNIEIVKVTDRTTDTLTVIRARDGTTALLRTTGRSSAQQLLRLVNSRTVKCSPPILPTWQ
jgi:hypothetical protein